MNILENGFVPSINSFDKINFGGKTTDKNSTEDESFMDVLNSKLQEVNDKQLTSDNITEEFVSGGDVEIHEVMLAGEEAKMSLELAVQIRNKIVDAFQELNRTQI